jgi:hypothetical protein
VKVATVCRESIVPILVCTYSWSAFSQQTAYHLGSDQPDIGRVMHDKKKTDNPRIMLVCDFFFSNFGSEM